MKYLDSALELVVTAKDAADAARLENIVPPSASVAPLPGAPGVKLIRFAEGGTPRELARSLQQRLGARFRVLPALRDPSGLPVYPTGEVTVRFAQPVTDVDLGRFATANSLKLLRRDKLAPLQAVFALRDSNDQYLLDVIEAAEKDPRVRLAWPVTLGRYTKA